eukprot:11957874-Karenia_brevis.AAC.1
MRLEKGALRPTESQVASATVTVQAHQLGPPTPPVLPSSKSPPADGLIQVPLVDRPVVPAGISALAFKMMRSPTRAWEV